MKLRWVLVTEMAVAQSYNELPILRWRQIFTRLPYYRFYCNRILSFVIKAFVTLCH